MEAEAGFDGSATTSWLPPALAADEMDWGLDLGLAGAVEEAMGREACAGRG